MSSNLQSIASYYDHTLVHYKQHWKLKTNHALHYGIWEKDTKNLSEALINTNKLIGEIGDIKPQMKVLDAGCGVGGTSIFLAKKYGCKIKGITLSNNQLKTAQAILSNENLNDLVCFELNNFEQTNYPKESFDLIYGIESVCHSVEKLNVILEAKRLLKPGGKLIVLDFFQKKNSLLPKETEIMNSWLSRWAIQSLENPNTFYNKLEKSGFKTVVQEDLTIKVIPSAKRLYYASFLGFLPSKIYSIYNPKVNNFAKNHYKSAFYQYMALKKGLWAYLLYVSIKKSS